MKHGRGSGLIKGSVPLGLGLEGLMVRGWRFELMPAESLNDFYDGAHFDPRLEDHM